MGHDMAHVDEITIQSAYHGNISLVFKKIQLTLWCDGTQVAFYDHPISLSLKYIGGLKNSINIVT